MAIQVWREVHHQLRIHPAYSNPFCRLVTVWSAPNYCYRCGNEAAILRLGEDGKREMTVYGPAAENDTDSHMRERRQVRIQSVRMHEIEIINCIDEFSGERRRHAIFCVTPTS
jgi:hypothetical protein